MPQFPFHHPKTPDESLPEENGNSKKNRKPIQFRRVESKGPVVRKRISRGSRSSSHQSKRNPFNDEGIFDDNDSLIRFRDEVGKPLLLAIAAVVIVILIYRWSQPAESDKVVQETVATLMKDADSYDYGFLESDSDFEKRMGTANELIQLIKDPAAVDRGVELKLKTLTIKNTINLESGVDDDELANQLESLSREYIGNSNKRISRNARIGLMVIRVKQYLEQPEIQFFPEILDQFKIVADYAQQDFASAQNLLRVGDAFRKNDLGAEASQLYQAIHVAFSGSNDSKFVSIGSQARKKMTNQDSLFDELKSYIALVDQAKDFPITQIRNKVSEAISKDNITVSKLEGILDFADLLMKRNAVPIADAILKDISGAALHLDEGIERDAISKRIEDSKTMSRQFGKAFDYSGLFSVEGRPISRANLPQAAKIVVFWSPRNPQSVKDIRRIAQNSREFADRNIQVLAIATIAGSAEERNKILDTSNQTEGIDFLTAVRTASESQEFLQRYPVGKLPYWISLDRNDRIRGFNSGIEFVSLLLAAD